MTVTDIIEKRFGTGAGIYASLWMIPVYVGWLAAQLLGLGTMLHLLTGMSVGTGTIIGAAVVLLYTCAGGMWAVTLTDVVQVGLIIVGLVLVLPGAVNLAGGAGTLWSSLSASDISLAPQGNSFNDHVFYIGNWIIMGIGCMVGQDLIQRSLASKSDDVAVSSSVMSGFFYAIIAFIPITIGFAARLVLPKYGISSDVMGDDLENQVLPRMAMIVLGNMSPLLLTLFLAALSAAIMSSADSSLLAGASLLCNNVISPIFPRIKEKALLTSTRVVTVILTVLALYFALSVKSIYALMINSWVSQLVIIFVPVILALYVPRAGRSTAWATMMVGTVVWLGYTFVASCGSGLAFVDLLGSDQFERAITCGAVYGFVSAVVTAVLCHLGDVIAERNIEE